MQSAMKTVNFMKALDVPFIIPHFKYKYQLIDLFGTDIRTAFGDFNTLLPTIIIITQCLFACYSFAKFNFAQWIRPFPISCVN